MYIAQTNSTNDYLKTHPNIDELYTSYQTDGRGQVGNGWESEKDKNVLLSVRLKHTNLLAANQWQVCVMACVALWQTIAQYIKEIDKLYIKWPNDLYYEDKKLAGILIENTIMGGLISESIVGIGLNINQTKWGENIPNPTSLKEISGIEYDIEKIVYQLMGNLRNIGVTTANCVDLYLQHLYRKTGWYWWEEREVNMLPTKNGEKSEQSFEARIAGITSRGELILCCKDGKRRTYHFKQIKYII